MFPPSVTPPVAPDEKKLSGNAAAFTPKTQPQKPPQ
jgi:hypothetical protein